MNAKQLAQLERAVFWALFSLALLCIIGLTIYRIGEPVWEAGHHGWHMAVIPHSALSYLRFGYLDTKLGAVTNWGEVRPEEGFSYRADYSFLLYLLISFAYRIFGVYPWSARLVPVLLCVGTSLTVFLLSLRLTDRHWTALVAMVFCGLSPLYVCYGRMPGQNSMAVFFPVLTICLYWFWFTTQRRRYLYGTFIALVLGANAEWIAYFAVPPILVHYLVFCDGERSWRFVIALALSPILLFAAFALWQYWLTNGASLQSLRDVFLFRTASVGQRSLYVFTAHEWWAMPGEGLYYRSMYWLTTPVVMLSLVWLIGFFRALTRCRVSPEAGLICALFLFGFAYVLIFNNLTFIHDFIMLYSLVPASAVAAASAVTWIVTRHLRRAPILVAPALMIIGYLFVEQSIGVFKVKTMGLGILPEMYTVGKTLNEIVAGDRKVIYVSEAPDVRMSVEIDRPYTVIETIEGLMTAINGDPAYQAVVLRNQDSVGVGSELRHYLVHNYPRQDVCGYSIFELDKRGSNVLVKDPPIENPHQVRFGDDLEFLGFDLDQVIYQQDRQITWWEKYFNPHAEFLPQHRTTFHVVYYWRNLQEASTDHTLVTQFDTQVGELCRIDQSHQGLDGVYPTSFWQPGQIIREEYEIEIPPIYPPLRYALWVGVTDGDMALVSQGSDLQIDGKNRVRVGEIEVQPPQMPLSLQVRPEPQFPTQVRVNDEIALVGYDLDVTGNGITVASYWQSLPDSYGDYDLALALRNGAYEIRRRVEIAPSRLWEAGQFYRGDVSFSPYLLDAEYEIYLLAQDEQGTSYEFPLTTVDWRSEPRRALVRQIGEPDRSADDMPLLSRGKSLQLDFELPEQQNVEVMVGWVGQSEYDETRVQVFVHNDDWVFGQDKYLDTLVIRAGGPTVSRIRVPRRLTREGSNSVIFTVRLPTLVGWRRALATWIPDIEPLLGSGALLRHRYVPYHGWVEPDFIQVRASEWHDTWDTYYSLARVYSKRGMYPELGYLYDEAVQNDPTVPIKEVGVFGEAFFKTGDYDKADQIFSKILADDSDDLTALSMLGQICKMTGGDCSEWERRLEKAIPNPMSGSLGDKIEFLGYDIVSLSNGQTQMSFYFQCLEETETDYTLYLHGHVEDMSILSEDRKLHGFANWDHAPSVPTSQWREGIVYQDMYVTQITPGEYQLILGFYSENAKMSGEVDLGWKELYAELEHLYRESLQSGIPLALEKREKLGKYLFENGEYDKAKQIFLGILADDPRNLTALFVLGQVYEMLGQDRGDLDMQIEDAIPNQFKVNLDDKIEFLGYEIVGLSDRQTQMSFYFRCLKEVETDYTLYVHGQVEDVSILDEDRRPHGFANWDHPLSVPTSQWQEGGIYQDIYTAQITPGKYHLLLGFYSANKKIEGHIDLGWMEIGN